MQHEFVIRSKGTPREPLRFLLNRGALSLPEQSGTAEPVRILSRGANGVIVVLWGQRVISGIITRSGERGETITLNAGGDVYELSVREAMLDAMEQGLSATGPGISLLELKSPIPGLVKNVLVKAGDAVTSGQTLIVLEAMKMENEIAAIHDGTIDVIAVKPGQAVAAGALLVTLKT